MAYAAIVFARIEGEKSNFVHLLSAKSRVAPKKSTIPRLELMAATIAVRLASNVTQSLTRKVVSVNYWSDSTTVLAWIKRDLELGTFVRNRIKEIRSASEPERWGYVPGHLNSADLPSRGCTASKLRESEWWLGPKWLYRAESEWPSIKGEIDEDLVKGEIKKSSAVHLSTELSNFEASKIFSSYTQLVRFLAWMNRFSENCRQRKADDRNVKFNVQARKDLHLSMEEIKSAEVKLLKHLQETMFKDKVKNKLSAFKTYCNTNGLYVLKTKIFNLAKTGNGKTF